MACTHKIVVYKTHRCWIIFWSQPVAIAKRNRLIQKKLTTPISLYFLN